MNDPLGESNDSTIHYNNLPSVLKLKFPLRGTTYWGKGENNELELSQTTIVYMLRNPGWGEWRKMMNLRGWEATGINGNFIGKYDAEIYKRLFKPGKYELDDSSALYLFDSGNLYGQNILSIY